MKKKGLAILIVALAIAACSDDSVAPVDKAIGGPQLIIATEAEVNRFLPMLDDLMERVLPALNDEKVSGALGMHTGLLMANMKARNTEGARAAHDAALAIVQEYSARVGADALDAADIESVMLTLGTADEMIGK